MKTISMTPSRSGAHPARLALFTLVFGILAAACTEDRKTIEDAPLPIAEYQEAVSARYRGVQAILATAASEPFAAPSELAKSVDGLRQAVNTRLHVVDSLKNEIPTAKSELEKDRVRNTLKDYEDQLVEPEARAKTFQSHYLKERLFFLDAYSILLRCNQRMGIVSAAGAKAHAWQQELTEHNRRFDDASRFWMEALDHILMNGDMGKTAERHHLALGMVKNLTTELRAFERETKEKTEGLIQLDALRKSIENRMQWAQLVKEKMPADHEGRAAFLAELEAARGEWQERMNPSLSAALAKGLSEAPEDEETRKALIEKLRGTLDAMNQLVVPVARTLKIRPPANS